MGNTKSETKEVSPDLLSGLVGGLVDLVLPDGGEYGKDWGRTYQTTITDESGRTYEGTGSTPESSQQAASGSYQRGR